MTATDILRSQIPSLTILGDAFYAVGEIDRGDLGSGSLYIKGTSGGLRAIQDAAGTWWNLSCPFEVNVGWFGAKGDDVTDDRAAIQAAIDYATTVSKNCRMPAAEYRIGAALVLTKAAHVTLYGDGRWETRIAGTSGYSGAYIEHGSANPGGGAYSTVRDIGFFAPSSGAAEAIRAKNCNATTYSGLHFEDMVIGLSMENCFAVHIVDCTGVRGANWVYSSTKAHNLVIDRCRVYGVTAQAVRVDNDTDGITISNSDIEYCGCVLQAATGAGVITTGITIFNTYIEGNQNVEFVFDNCQGFSLVGCYVAMAGANPIDGPDSADLIPRIWNNINNGRIENNSMFRQHVGWGANVDGIDVGTQYIYAAASMAPPPWKTPSFLNSWAAGARAPGYRKNSLGEVLMRGSIVNGTSGATAFQLPAGYRPGQQCRFLQAGNAAVAVLLIVDSANGNVVPTTSSGSECNLDGVRFHAP